MVAARRMMTTSLYDNEVAMRESAVMRLMDVSDKARERIVLLCVVVV